MSITAEEVNKKLDENKRLTKTVVEEMGNLRLSWDKLESQISLRKKWQNATAIIQVCITTPIYYYLVYWVLSTLGAPDLVMFLFWVYVPFHAVVSAIRIALTKPTE
jgi:hypothetical protein